jgi:hypothetical protein
MNRDPKPSSVVPVGGTRCARCGLPVAAWRVEVDGATFCTSFCANAAGALEAHDDEQPQSHRGPP